MAKVHRVCLGILTAFALCKCCLAGWNATVGPTDRPSDDCKGENCTEDYTEQMNGHFSKCPEWLKDYCIHGECRYVIEQNAPSCRCQPHFIGSRCEFVHLEQTDHRQRIIIGCVVGGLVVLIALLVFVCLCSRHLHNLCRCRRRQQEEPKNRTEKISMMDRNGTGEPTETTPTVSV